MKARICPISRKRARPLTQTSRLLYGKYPYLSKPSFEAEQEKLLKKGLKASVISSSHMAHSQEKAPPKNASWERRKT